MTTENFETAALPAPAPASLTLGLLLTAAITGSLAFLQVYSIQSILPVLMHEFHLNAVAAGATVGATVLAMAMMSPFMGMLSDAWGRRWIIIGSVFFLSVPTFAMCFVHNIDQIWWLRFLQGLVVPGISVVLLAYIGEEFDGIARVKLMSFYVSGTVFGGFMGRFLLGWLNEFIGWRYAFLFMALLSVAGGVLVLKQLPPSKRFVPKPHVSQALKMLWQHLHNRHVLSACALGFCVLFSLVGCFTYINLYLAAPPYDLSSAGLANIFTVYLIGMVITPVAGRLISRFGAVRTALLAVALSVFGVLLTLDSHLWLVILALVMMSTGVFITQASTLNYIAHHVTEGRSLASGLYYMAYYGGGTVGAFLCGHAFEIGGWPAAVNTLIIAQVAAMIIAGVLMAKKKI
ncbi:MFS transporter [Stenoxybacter acetivorans]|uniref:MFS transporter n=1 Tax=Stenoxybacter acetivorans TaxID=422441 RepID=UPI00068CB374|nr:MFS transporter [Stenoxybacter acetivorans]